MLSSVGCGREAEASGTLRLQGSQDSCLPTRRVGASARRLSSGARWQVALAGGLIDDPRVILCVHRSERVRREGLLSGHAERVWGFGSPPGINQFAPNHTAGLAAVRSSDESVLASPLDEPVEPGAGSVSLL